MSFWHKSKLFGGYWGWFWSRRTGRLMLAFNEAGHGFTFNLQLWRGFLPCGYYAAICLFGRWHYSCKNLRA